MRSYLFLLVVGFFLCLSGSLPSVLLSSTHQDRSASDLPKLLEEAVKLSNIDDKGKREQALLLTEQGIEQARLRNDAFHLCKFLEIRGFCFMMLRRHNEAMEVLREALPLAKQQPEALLVHVLNWMANTLNAMGDAEQLAGVMDQLIDFHDQRKEAKTLFEHIPRATVAYQQWTNAPRERVHAFLNRAVELHQRYKYEKGLGWIYYRRAHENLIDGAFNQALLDFTEAAPRLPREGGIRAGAQACHNVAYLSFLQGRLPTAKAFVNDALRRFDQVNPKTDPGQTTTPLAEEKAMVWALLAQIYEHQRDGLNMARALTHANALRQTVLDKLHFRGTAALNRGDIELARRNYAGAEKEYRRAVEAYRSAAEAFQRANFPLLEATAHHVTAALLIERGDYSQGIRKAEKAIALYEAYPVQPLIPTFMGEYSRLRTADIYGLLAMAYQATDEPWKALAIAEQGEAQGLKRQALMNADISQVLGAEDAVRWKKSVEQYRKSASAVFGASTASPVASVLAAHFVAAREVNELSRQFAAKSPAFGALMGNSSVNTQELLRFSSEHSDTLYLKWSLTETKAVLFALRGGKLHTFPLLFGEKLLNAKIARWNESIFAWHQLRPGSPDAVDFAKRPDVNKLNRREPEFARELHTLLLGNVEKAGLLDNPTRRIVFLPTGPLYEVPFLALRPSNVPLTDRFGISTASSFASLMASLPTHPATKKLVVVANPSYGNAAPGNFAEATGASRSALPAIWRAANEIAQEWGSLQPLWGQAVRNTAGKEKLASGRILLFGTHGKLLPDNGLHSYLELASGDNGKAPLKLEAWEVAYLPLAAQLAVLAACDSGGGEPGGGEGLLGFSWAFQAAGCPTLLASRWRVDDAATGALLKAFFEEIRRLNLPVDTALKNAVKRIRKAGYSQPYFWAAFQVMGKTSPLYPKH
jgi:tetratricopeptide (TPR) repeat protein